MFVPQGKLFNMVGRLMIEVSKGKVADTRPQCERRERLDLNGSVRLRARDLCTAKQQVTMHGYRCRGGGRSGNGKMTTFLAVAASGSI